MNLNGIFISLYWKVALGLALLFVALTTIITHYGEQQLTTVHEYNQDQKYAQNQQEYSGLINRSELQLTNLIGSLALLGNPNLSFIDGIENHWSDIQITWGVESIALYDDKNTKLGHWGDQRIVPSEEALKTALTKGLPAKEKVCNEQCSLAITAPLLGSNGQLFLVQMSMSLADTMLDFQNITGSDIGFLTEFDRSGGINPRLGNTGYSISAMTNRDRFEPILHELVPAKHLELSSKMGKSSHTVMFRNDYYDVVFHTNNELSQHNAIVVFMTNTTARLAQNEEARNTYIFSGFLSAVITMILVIVAIWRPIRSIQRHSKALPLLSEGKYTQAKEQLHSMASGRLFDDEVSQLQDTALTVTDQLESYNRKLMENSEELYKMAHFDSLTGLFNRAHLANTLDNHLQSPKEEDREFCILYLDLDNFKHVNDALGHEIGDKLLCVIAERLTSLIHPGDFVARLGGDEFCVVLNQSNSQPHATVMARAIIHMLEDPIEIEGRRLSVTPSIGITLAPLDGKDSGTLLQNADLAMYKAKSEGKKRYHLFDEQMNKDASSRIALEEELRRAVKNKEFVLYYQPQIDLRTNELMGCEALIRWDHPERGILSPFFFIDALENNGLIIEVGRWVIEEASRQCAEWAAQGMDDLKISVNLSTRQFGDPQLISNIRGAIEQAGISPSQLELEVTESLLATNIDHAIKLLTELQDLGLSIAIDDFGTGYSSLSYLKQLPLDKLKIDRAFVKDIPDDKDDMQITSAIVAMAHSLGLKVVAEGVETSEQDDYLKELTCEFGQGYLYDKPISAEDLFNTELMQRKLKATENPLKRVQ